MPQPSGGGVALGHQLVRVGVAQLFKRKGAALGNAHSLGQQVGGVDRRQGLPGAQVPFAVLEQPPPGLGHRRAMAHRREHVLQCAPAPQVHVHIARGHQRHTQASTHAAQLFQAQGIGGLAVQLHGDPQPVGKQTAQPRALGFVGRVAGHPQREQPWRWIRDVLSPQLVTTLRRAAARDGDPPTEGRVASQVRSQEHHLGPVVQLDLAAHDERHAELARGFQSADDAGHRAFVGDGQRVVAGGLGAFEEFFRARGAALKAEGRQAMQLGVSRQRGGRGPHAKKPWSMKGPS